MSEISNSLDSFIAVFRQDIVNARIKLASPNLSSVQEQELWQIVECREWFIKMLARAYEAELEQIDRDLEAALRR